MDEMRMQVVSGRKIPSGRVRFLAMTVIGAFGLASAVFGHSLAQSQSATSPAPAFEYEVASIKPNRSGGNIATASTTEARFMATNVTLQSLLLKAYGVQDFQISGAPSWLNAERFDIAAEMEDTVAEAIKKLDPAERGLARQQMLRALLMDRLRLSIHHENKDIPIYTLVIGRNGSKLKEAKEGDTYPDGLKSSGGHGGTGIWQTGGRGGTEVVTGQGVSIADLAATLSRSLDRPVLDKTGLTGKYDFAFNWADMNQLQASSDNAPAGRPATLPLDVGGPSLFSAIQEQLGLRLVSGKGPGDIIVIDHVERPSEN